MNKAIASIGIALLLVAGVAGALWWKGPLAGHPEMDAGAMEKERKILYYKCPMGQPDYSDKPGTAACGMDYVPVYDDETGPQEEGVITISSDKLRNIGVRTAPVERRALHRTLRTVGNITYDEKRVTQVQSKVEGWIEKLYIDFTGQAVGKDAILLEVYSPQLVSSQEEYLAALEYREKMAANPYAEIAGGAESLVRAARKRLDYLDVPPHQIKEIEEKRKVFKTLHIHAPSAGVVIEKHVQAGSFITPGMPVYTLADVSRVWLYASIYEHELSLVRTGQKARVTLNAYPGEAFHATVTYIYPYLDTKTRTAMVRLEMVNPKLRLKPGMYANLEIDSTISKDAVAIPEDALLDTGERQAVIVALGGGRFRVQEVRAGLKGEGYYEILSGLSAGETVVVSANFFIDSESSFRTLAGTLAGGGEGKGASDKGEKGPEAASGRGEDAERRPPPPTGHAGH